MIAKGQLVLIAFLILVLASGCGDDRSAPASLTGTVKYKGEPVTAGTVTLHTANAGVYPLTIRSDGAYSGTDLPAGEMVVTITSPQPGERVEYGKDRMGAGASEKPAMASPKGGPEGTFPTPGPVQSVQVPPKYATKEQSGLTVTLTKGKNKYDFDLE